MSNIIPGPSEHLGQFAHTCLIDKTSITYCHLKRIDLEIPTLGIDSRETIINLCKDFAARMLMAMVFIKGRGGF